MTRSRHILASLALVAALAFAAAGCGGDDDTTTAAPAVSNDVSVSLTEYAATPSNVLPDDGEGGPPTSKATTGEVTFTITNDGSETHSFVFNISGQATEIPKPLAPGESTELTVDVPTSGFYEYYCPIGDHQDQGMQGQLEVE